jgi:hypothetical protein
MYADENADSCLGQAQNLTGLNRLIGSQPLLIIYKGKLLIKDTFTGSLQCPLFTCLTVSIIYLHVLTVSIIYLHVLTVSIIYLHVLTVSIIYLHV